MELIDGFNICLEAAGFRPISDINLDDNQVSQINTLIDREKRQVLYDGYPFNTDRVNLTVNVDDEIDVSGFLRVELPVGLVVLDNKVWDPRNSEFWSDDILDIWVVTDRDWDNVPELFQEWIARRAAGRFVSAIGGPDDVYSEARLREGQAFSGAHNSDDAQWDPGVLRERRVRQRGGGSFYGQGGFAGGGYRC